MRLLMALGLAVAINPPEGVWRLLLEWK